ncbi:MAG: MBL fold metallo-hydrolase [Maribacter sp.]
MKSKFVSKQGCVIITLLIMVFCHFVNAQNAKIEYIAHAAFVIESDKGTRVLIDPYHSYRQMGFTFPDNIEVDFTLITHPHYDHDASMYVSENAPVYREEGQYRFKDISFKGIASKHSHAARLVKSGKQSYNTIWVVEVDDVQIAHLGDNEVLTKDEVELLAGVDYIIGHPNDEQFTKFDEVTYIPNHYLLPEVTKHTNWMQPVDEWLVGKKGVVKLESNVLHLKKEIKAAKILVFKPSSLVKEWPANYYNTLAAIAEGKALIQKSKNIDDALAGMDKAIDFTPYVLDGYLNKAQLLFSKKQDYLRSIAILQEGFAKVSDMDWGNQATARKILADAYSATNQKELAYHQYLWLKRHNRIVNINVREEATTFIAEYEKGL